MRQKWLYTHVRGRKYNLYVPFGAEWFYNNHYQNNPKFWVHDTHSNALRYRLTFNIPAPAL